MVSIPTSSLRERSKTRRQAEIVGAAAGLWREHGIDTVSLNQIAAAAEVAPQTVYNLIGGLDAIGFAVIKLALARLDAALDVSSAAGVDLALESARLSVALYTEDARLFRQLLVRIPGALFEGTHLGRDVAQIPILAVAQAQAAGEISREIDPDRLGRAIFTGYLGALYDWACGDADDATFLHAAEIAVLAPLAACASEAARPTLTALLFERLCHQRRDIAAS